MRFVLILPITYIVVAVVLVVGFGRVGHGRGIDIFYYLSLPSGAISDVIGNGDWALLFYFIAGVVQYLLLGYVIDLALRRKRAKDVSAGKVRKNPS